MKKIKKNQNPLCLIIILCFSLFSPLYGQTWQWAEHAGQEIDGDHSDQVKDLFIDSEGNSYFLVHYDGCDEPVLCGEPIELIHKNKGAVFFALVSLDPNGELRWYKALYGTFIYYSSLSDTTFEECRRMQEARLGFDGEDLVLVASSLSQIRITDGMGGDTLLPTIPDTLCRYNYFNYTYSNNGQNQDVIMKINTDGEILWTNALNSIYPVPTSSTYYNNGVIRPLAITIDEEKNIHITYDILVGEDTGWPPSPLPNNNPTYEHYCLKLNAEGEHIETTPIYTVKGVYEFFFHNGKFHLFFNDRPSFLNFPGVDLPAGLPNALHVLWTCFSENWELEAWKLITCDDLMDVELKNDDFYILSRNRLLKFPINGDTTIYTNGYNTANPPFDAITFIDDENIVLFGEVWTKFINEEFHFQGLPIPSTFDKSGAIVALFHEPTREFYYISPVAQLFKDGQKSAIHLHIERTPDGNLITAGTFLADRINFGDFNIENVGSLYDVFFAKFGFPLGAPTAWPQHPSVSAVEHYLLNKITLFPNPVQNTINLESEGTPITMVCIYDLTGRKVVQHPCFSSHSVNINLSHIPRDMYIARIFTHAGVVERKFLKGL